MTRPFQPAVSERAPGAADLGEPTTLVLLRHGRTAFTEQRRFSGGGGEDPDLSEAGRQDADRAAAAVASLGREQGWLTGVGTPTVLITSPRARARQTADAVAGRTGLVPRVEPDWTEIRFGDWDGLTFGEIAGREPAALGEWQGSSSFAPPGGESLDQLDARVRRAREAVVREHPRDVVVIATHTTPVRAVVREVLAAAPASLWRIQVAPCSLSVARFWADGHCDLVTVNATGHLR